MKTIQVFTRRGCHLCEQLIEELLPLARHRADVVVHDVDNREEWREAYGMRVPVVEYDGEPVCQYHLDREALARILSLNEPNT